METLKTNMDLMSGLNYKTIEYINFSILYKNLYILVVLHLQQLSHTSLFYEIYTKYENNEKDFL